MAEPGPLVDGCGCAPASAHAACVGDLSTPEDRLTAVRNAIAEETEPLVTLTHLLRLCRDDHPVLRERMNDVDCRARVACVHADLAAALPEPGAESTLEPNLRRALAAALAPGEGIPAVVVARALAELLDTHFGDSFAAAFAARSPYQPHVGDPVPLDSPDLRRITALPPTSPPWRLANRLDETRRVRLAGEWAAEFRVVFDYCLADILTGVVDRNTVVATCHPNRAIAEFVHPEDRQGRSFPVRPRDLDRQRADLDRLIRTAVAAGASVVVLPELSVTEPLAVELEHWVRDPAGPRLLVAGSFHTEGARWDNGPGDPAPRRRNTALAWVRGSDRPLIHDKHSPAEHPIHEDIRPQGWPELRIYVTRDGSHVVIAICRDLLNPHAVHALNEAGANLVLVPAMSESLMPFGGPVAQLVGSEQAFVAVANNPALWTEADGPVTPQTTRALLGHPGFARQTRAVATADPGPGVALMTVFSGDVTWVPAEDGPAHAAQSPAVQGREDGSLPDWMQRIADRCLPRGTDDPMPTSVTLRTAAVLLLLADGPDGPTAVLTERTPELTNYPGELVFAGGATDAGDKGPVSTALREAREEVGLNPRSVRVIGLLPAVALPESGFLVTPVLAWAPSLPALHELNSAEVQTVVRVSLSRWRSTAQLGQESRLARPTSDRYGRLTARLLHHLASSLADE